MPDPVLGEAEEGATLPDEMTVGCADLPPGLRRARFFQRLRYLEVGGTRFQLPKLQVFKRWREETGDTGRVGLVAPQTITDRPSPKGYPRIRPGTHTKDDLGQAGSFRDTAFVRREVERLAEACVALDADTVVFRSPPDFAPSSSNRDRLRAFFQDIAPAERFAQTTRVWEPQGLWELATAAPMAQELGVALSCDPLTNDPLIARDIDFSRLPVSQVYFRITGLGRGETRFDDYALEPLLDIVEPYDRVWIVFAHSHRYPDAIRCQRLLASNQAG